LGEGDKSHKKSTTMVERRALEGGRRSGVKEREGGLKRASNFHPVGAIEIWNGPVVSAWEAQYYRPAPRAANHRRKRTWA
jgi:hypothetical protein